MNVNDAKFPIVVLISGYGSNLQAIMNEIDAGFCPAEIRAVLSNEPEASGLERAKRANIPTEVIQHRDFQNRKQFEKALMKSIDKYQPKLIVLAGFKRILGNEFIQHYPKRIINVHPSLLPKYPGLNSLEQVLAAGETEHGVSIHFVTNELDAGPLIVQIKVPVLKDDTVVTLGARIQQLEQKLYPQVITWFATGKIKCGN